MSTSLADLAELVGGRVCGDASLSATGAATLAVAEAGQITLVDHEDRAAQLAKSAAVAAIVPVGLLCEAKATIEVDDVHAAFSQVVIHFRPQRKQRRVGICPGAQVSPTAQIGADVDIHPGARIGDEVTIGPGSTVHSGVQILPGCVIGAQVTLFPNVVLYEDTHIGARSIVHAGAVVGAYGFGYQQEDGRHVLSHQLGNVEIGDDVEIGACATIDRGTYGPTIIGEGTKIDNLVQIAHNCRLGKHNLICSQVGIAGSTTTGDYVVMAGQVGVRDHVHIGTGAVLASKAGIANNVGEGETMLGQPATALRRQKLQMASIAKLPEMRRQFRAMQRQFAEFTEQLQPPQEAQEEGHNDQAA